MVWWLGRSYHRSTVTESDTAMGNVVEVRTARTALL